MTIIFKQLYPILRLSYIFILIGLLLSLNIIFVSAMVINVNDYGSLNDAINSCDINQHCTVFMPGGEYVLTGDYASGSWVALKLFSNLSLVGSGKGITRVAYPADGGYGGYMGLNDNIQTFENFEISHLTLDGRYLSGGIGIAGINNNDYEVKNIKIHDVSFENFATFSLYFVPSSNHPWKISNIDIYNNDFNTILNKANDQVEVSGDGYRIYNNFFSNPGGGSSLTSGNLRNSYINDNTFNGGSIFISLENTLNINGEPDMENIHISDNSFKNSTNSPFRITYLAGSSTSKNLWFNNNLLYNTGVVQLHDVDNVHLTDNIIDNSIDVIDGQFRLNGVSNVIISRNIMNNSGMPLYIRSGKIYKASSNILISQNVISNINTYKLINTDTGTVFNVESIGNINTNFTVWRG